MNIIKYVKKIGSVSSKIDKKYYTKNYFRLGINRESYFTLFIIERIKENNRNLSRLRNKISRKSRIYTLLII